jgi:hypothetical protein
MIKPTSPHSLNKHTNNEEKRNLPHRLLNLPRQTLITPVPQLLQNTIQYREKN